jgi:hypothetical protein
MNPIMAADWNLAQVLIGVLAIVATYSLARGSSYIALAIRKLFRPQEFQCERLEWSDIPEGILHQCTIPKEHCEHVILAQKDTTEWEPVICTFFQWIKRGNFVPKPAVLDLSVRYIRTDQRVLKTLLGLTSDVHSRGYSNERGVLVFEGIGSVVTCYFKPRNASTSHQNPPDVRLEVSKIEAEKIIDGYPPWYCETLLLVNGDRIPHPIKSDDDVRRGGWIVAIGLSNTIPTARDFMTRGVRDQSQYSKAMAPGRPCITVNRAFARVAQCLSSAAAAFPQEPAVGHARRLLKDWIAEYSHWGISSLSGVFNICVKSPLYQLFPGGHWVQDKKREYASVLSTHQCQMAMQAFSHLGAFSAEEKEALEPVILVVLRAVMVGCFAVLEFLSYIERKAEDSRMEKMWQELDEKHGPIYLRQWKDEDWH